MSDIEYKTGTRLCGICSAIGNHELLSRQWTAENGVVETYRCLALGHEWQESRLPLDDPRNLNPRRRETPVKPRKIGDIL